MSFFEEIAAALDADGIESRVLDDTLFVPITSELEVQFVEIDPVLPAANVYIAVPDDNDGEDDEFDAVLVSVAFSVEDAVAAVARHIATDQMVTVLEDLLEGTDERIDELNFYQDPVDPQTVYADVASASEISVELTSAEGTPTARVSFITYTRDYERAVDKVIDQLWEADDDTGMLSDRDRALMFNAVSEQAASLNGEVLELGSYTDFDRLFEVLSLAADQAEEWESQMVPELDDVDDADPYYFEEDPAAGATSPD